MKTLGCRKSDEEGGSEEGKSALFRIRGSALLHRCYTCASYSGLWVTCQFLVGSGQVRWQDSCFILRGGARPGGHQGVNMRQKVCFGVYSAAVGSQCHPGLFDSILWLFEKNSLCSDRREGENPPVEGLRVGARGLDSVRSSSPLYWLRIFDLYLKFSFFYII